MNGCTDEGLFKVGLKGKKELDPWLMMPSRTQSGSCGLRLLAVAETFWVHSLGLRNL